MILEIQEILCLKNVQSITTGLNHNKRCSYCYYRSFFLNYSNKPSSGLSFSVYMFALVTRASRLGKHREIHTRTDPTAAQPFPTSLDFSTDWYDHSVEKYDCWPWPDIVYLGWSFYYILWKKTRYCLQRDKQLILI